MCTRKVYSSSEYCHPKSYTWHSLLEVTTRNCSEMSIRHPEVIYSELFRNCLLKIALSNGQLEIVFRILRLDIVFSKLSSKLSTSDRLLQTVLKLSTPTFQLKNPLLQVMYSEHSSWVGFRNCLSIVSQIEPNCLLDIAYSKLSWNRHLKQSTRNRLEIAHKNQNNTPISTRLSKNSFPTTALLLHALLSVFRPKNFLLQIYVWQTYRAVCRRTFTRKVKFQTATTELRAVSRGPSCAAPTSLGNSHESCWVTRVLLSHTSLGKSPWSRMWLPPKSSKTQTAHPARPKSIRWSGRSVFRVLPAYFPAHCTYVNVS